MFDKHNQTMVISSQIERLIQRKELRDEIWTNRTFE